MDLADKWEHAQRLYGGKVKTFARNARGQVRGFDEDDLVQELLVVLYESVLYYDPDYGGASFNTFFQRNAKNRVITLIRFGSTKGRTAIVQSMTDDVVLAEMDLAVAEPAADEQALLRIEIQGFVDKYGPEVLDGRFAKQIKAAM